MIFIFAQNMCFVVFWREMHALPRAWRTKIINFSMFWGYFANVVHEIADKIYFANNLQA